MREKTKENSRRVSWRKSSKRNNVEKKKTIENSNKEFHKLVFTTYYLLSVV